MNKKINTKKVTREYKDSEFARTTRKGPARKHRRTQGKSNEQES